MRTYEYEFQKLFWHYMSLRELKLDVLGDYLGVTKGAISKWVRGRVRFPAYALERTCRLFRLAGNKEEEFLSAYEEFWGQKQAEQSKAAAPEQIEAQDKRPSSQVPLDRPKPVPHFVLRYDEEDRNELNLILADLAPGHIVTLWGPPGIGKTALAIAAIWALTADDRSPAQFPDGILFLDFQEQPSVDSALYQIAKVFGDTEPGRPTPREAAQRALLDRQALLVLDGTENADADQLDKLLKITGKCGVLITTQRRMDITGVEHIVDVLPPHKSIAVLQAWSRVFATDVGKAYQICELVGFLPLALRIAGRYMFVEKVYASEYVVMLKETPLEALTIPERQRESIPLLIQKSLTRVSELSRRAIAVMGVLALSPVDLEVIASALGLARTKARQVLGELVNYSLLERADQRYQVTHILIYVYAYQAMTVPEETLKPLMTYLVAWIKELPQLSSEELLANALASHIMVLINKTQLAPEHIVQLELAFFKRLFADRMSMHPLLYPFYLDNTQIQLRPHGELMANMLEAGYPFNTVVSAANANMVTLLSPETYWFEVLTNRQNLVAKMTDPQFIEMQFDFLSFLTEIEGIETPLGAVCLYYLGLSHNLSGEHEEAIEYLKHGIDISNEFSEHDVKRLLLGTLIDSYAALNRDDEADSYLRSDLSNYDYLVDVFLRVELLELAALLCVHRIQLRPGDAIKALVKLGIIFKYQGKEAKAQELFRHALKIWKPGMNPLTLYDQLQYKSLAYLGLGRADLATFIQKVAQRNHSATTRVDFAILHLYKLLAKAPSPPQNLNEVRSYLVQTINEDLARRGREDFDTFGVHVYLRDSTG